MPLGAPLYDLSLGRNGVSILGSSLQTEPNESSIIMGNLRAKSLFFSGTSDKSIPGDYYYMIA